MKPHLIFAHELWEKALNISDFAIDATCGNGHDTLFLAKLLPEGKIYALDIQKTAIEKTKQKLIEAGLEGHVELFHQSHEFFPLEILPGTIQLIVYNLGYLPGADKTMTTMTNATLKSLQNALPLLKKGGIISITLYPGHPEGAIEAQAVLQFIENLPKDNWHTHHERFEARETAPSVIYIEKALIF